ncbi:MAG: hypothetical protein WBC59_09885, partial [Phycisphaerae bacterium]
MKKAVMIGCALVAMGLAARNAEAVDHTYWILDPPTVGDWSTDANWNSDEPGSGDNAYIDNGGTAQITAPNHEYCFSLYLGETSGDSGTVDMTGGTLSVTTDPYIGGGGDGTLNITGGGTVSNDNGLIGYKSGSTGVVTVDGTGCLYGDVLLSDISFRIWDNYGIRLYDIPLDAPGIRVLPGQENTGDHWFRYEIEDMSPEGGPDPDNQDIIVEAEVYDKYITDIFFSSQGSGHAYHHAFLVFGEVIFDPNPEDGSYFKLGSGVPVEGSGSTWTNIGDLDVGYHGTGTLNITGGGTVSNDNGLIGYKSG